MFSFSVLMLSNCFKWAQKIFEIYFSLHISTQSQFEQKWRQVFEFKNNRLLSIKWIKTFWQTASVPFSSIMHIITLTFFPIMIFLKIVPSSYTIFNQFSKYIYFCGMKIGKFWYLFIFRHCSSGFIVSFLILHMQLRG